MRVVSYMLDISAYSRPLFSRRSLLSAFTVWLLLGGVSFRAFSRTPEESSRPVERPRGRVVLKTFPVAPSGDLRYELSLGPCARSECPFQVRLIEGAQVYGTLDLEWGSVPERPGKTPVDGSLGAG